MLSIDNNADTTKSIASQKYATATDRSSPNVPRSQKTATGIATYSAHELFVQQNLNANPEIRQHHSGQYSDSSGGSSRSAACLLMLIMITVSLVNVALFMRLSGLNEANIGQPFDVLLVQNMRPQDVANLSSDQWIRMFYGYHLQHQNKIAELRRVLVTTIGSLKQVCYCFCQNVVGKFMIQIRHLAILLFVLSMFLLSGISNSWR